MLRLWLRLEIPKVTAGHYPVLLLPTDKAIYSKEEPNYNISPGFTYTLNLNNDIFGASEKYFFLKLTKYFGSDKVFHNAVLVTVNKNNFIPDFAYFDEEKHIYVDIEIDEPYSFKTKEPLHYGICDHNRNVFMRRGGWAVIRFSEKQVVQQPDACCKFIATYLAYAYIDKTKSEPFDLIDEVLIHKRWTKGEAEQLVLSDYRKKYL